jgi:uncharacterized protein involved in exopolysaccharide biosynthesis
MNYSTSHPEIEPEFGYGQILAVFYRRRWSAVIVLAIVLCASVVMTQRMKPTYRSQMQLLVEPNYPQKESLAEGTQKTQTSEEDYTTQLSLMQSSQFTDKAAIRLRGDYPEIQGSEIDGVLNLYRVEGTRIFEAAYTDTNPIKTQKVLAALQTVYQEYNLEQDKLRLTQGLAFVNEQSIEAREHLRQTEGSLEEFRKNQNLIDPEQQAKAVADALSAVEQERRTLRSQYAETQTRYDVLQQQLSLSPQAALTQASRSQSTRYQALLDELQKTDLELSRQRVLLTDSHPTIQDLLETRQQQLKLLAEERQRSGGLSPDRAVSGEALRQEGQLGTEYATELLDSLSLGQRWGAVTAMLGQGMGPLEEPKLRNRSRVVLPRVDFISLREELAGRPLLSALGVSPERLLTTGDDAIELAYQVRSPTWGNGLGINLRASDYSGVDGTVVARLRPILQAAAREYGAPLIPVPISRVPGEEDARTIHRLIAEDATPIEEAIAATLQIDTPLKVIEQLKQCRVAIVGSYHAAVFALSLGIPAIGLARSAYSAAFRSRWGRCNRTI